MHIFKHIHDARIWSYNEIGWNSGAYSVVCNYKPDRGTAYLVRVEMRCGQALKIEKI